MKTKICILGIIYLSAVSCNNDNSRDNHQDTKTITTKITTISQLAFDADGYYFPVDTIRYKDCILENVLIATTDKTTALGDKQILYAQIELVNNKTGENWEVITRNFELKNKEFKAVFKVKNIGIIKLTALFVGKNGPIHDHVVEDKTIVMKGEFAINDDYKRGTAFTYFAGE